MPAITSENAGAWQRIADSLASSRPTEGREVRVTKGRKHIGKMGRVVRHMRSKFADDRYVSEANAHLRDMRGTIGFVVLVQETRLNEEGVACDFGRPFWVSAENVEVLS